MLDQTKEQQLCTFHDGDRVQHRLFGEGTITKDPTKVYGASKCYRSVIFAGWKIQVEWDSGRKNAVLSDYIRPTT